MSTTEEIEEFVSWVQEEGGLADFLIDRGGFDAPEELETEVTGFLASWDVLRYAYKALLTTNDITY